MTCRAYRIACLAALVATGLAAARGVQAQQIDPDRGVDPTVDYLSLDRLGPWDDRNYALTAVDLELLPADEADLLDPIPAFYRVELRRQARGASGGGVLVAYPRSALSYFFLERGGYLVDGYLYRRAERVGGRFVVLTDGPGVPAGLSGAAAGGTAPGAPYGAGAAAGLTGEVRVTTPTGAAEAAVAMSPADPDRVVAGTVGPGAGQRMHHSADGGLTWSMTDLPLETACCDPTVAWSADGSKAYAASLGNNQVWFYRSGDGGASWTDLESLTPGDPRREIGTPFVISDKEYLHVDTHPASPHLDTLYLTWHDANAIRLSRSTDMGNTWSVPVQLSTTFGTLGLGSDATTDSVGTVHVFWHAIIGQTILRATSTDGGVTFGPPAQVAATEAAAVFPIPSMETRQVLVYVTADTDLSGGPWDHSIYLAWTDSTAPPVPDDPTANQARVRVARSRDGGASWTVATLTDATAPATADRWQPSLRVGPDGTVHVVAYDTRQDATRRGVDVFHFTSRDGGVTWSPGTRLTSVTSPNIADSGEFGDYKGLDVVENRLVTAFTDNRIEPGTGEDTPDSVDVYAAGLATGNLGYVLDGFGGVHAGGGAAVVTPPSPYFGFDIARDLELVAGGYQVLEGFGTIQPGGGVAPLGGTPFFGFDVARDLELLPGGGHMVLDARGGLHAGGGGSVAMPTSPYFGFDVARDLEIMPAGYLVLDAFGGLHPGGGASVAAPVTPYFGFDFAIDLEIVGGGYYVLDAFGAVHAGGGAPAVSPAPPFFGFRIARDMEAVAGGVLVLDGLGGVHAGGSVPAWTPPTPYFGFDIARDLEIR